MKQKVIKIAVGSLLGIVLLTLVITLCLGGETDPLEYEVEKGILSEDYVVKDADMNRLKEEICSHHQRRIDEVETLADYPYIVQLLRYDIGTGANLSPSIYTNLAKAGANPNDKSGEGESALHVAVQHKLATHISTSCILHGKHRKVVELGRIAHKFIYIFVNMV